MSGLVGVDLSDRRAVVTGGASGIGAAICHRPAADVLGLARVVEQHRRTPADPGPSGGSPVAARTHA